eukprot:1155343-Pelagomonas_calceolata.AAC.5
MKGSAALGGYTLYRENTLYNVQPSQQTNSKQPRRPLTVQSEVVIKYKQVQYKEQGRSDEYYLQKFLSHALQGKYEY